MSKLKLHYDRSPIHPSIINPRRWCLYEADFRLFGAYETKKAAIRAATKQNREYWEA